MMRVLRSTLLAVSAYVVMLPFAPLLGMDAAAQAQAYGPIAGALSVNGVQPDGGGNIAVAIPQPLTTVPPGDTPTGVAGSGLTYIPGNAAQPSLARATTVTTATGGTFTVSWATPLISSSPVINLIPVNPSGSQPVICNVTSRSASTVGGMCWSTQTVTLNLSIITAGLNLNPTAAGVSGMSVMVFARESTQ